jgi:hypothetical protein
MLRITLEGGEKLKERLRTAPASIIAVIKAAVDALDFQLVTKIVTEKLSGNPLHRRTGVLAGSVHAVPATATGTTVSGAVTGAAEPAQYGQAHEFGHDAEYPITAVNARVLHFVVGGRDAYARQITHPSIPALGWFSGTFQEFFPTMKPELQAALDKELEK